jgi:hypothetical protein
LDDDRPRRSNPFRRYDRDNDNYRGIGGNFRGNSRGDLGGNLRKIAWDDTPLDEFKKDFYVESDEVKSRYIKK